MLAVITLVMIPLASLGGVASASTVNAASQSPSADWWIWAAGLQQGQPTCGVTGQGPLFFVSELTPPSPNQCTVAHGQRVLAAVINFEWSKTEAQDPQLNSLFPPAICQDPAQAKLLACANWQAGHVTATSATLDGRRLPVIRLTAPAFTETWADGVDGNYFGVPPGPTPAAAAGYYVQLPPLTPGSHTLVVSGTVTNFPGLPTSPFTLGATITLHQE
ncbi:MAG: hypothetical protein ACXVX5_14765 [Mycobacterium sp.]